MKLLAACALTGAVMLGCGGSDEHVKTQNQMVTEEGGDVKQKTTITTTDEEGKIKDVEKKETEIHDN
ncbi:MAG: hypothetical protein WKG00_15550 [Polyangiaceae bacterium]